MNKKRKTLGDYFKWGTHELIAFVNGNRLSTKEKGNLLGDLNMGVLVCNKTAPGSDKDLAKFFYKDRSIYNCDSDIMFGDFYYSDAEVKSEVPLGISTNYFNHFHLKKRSKEFREAKKLLKKYGLY